jgi:hypothetical protein
MMTYTGTFLRIAMLLLLCIATHTHAEAATLNLHPGTGVYAVGVPFTVTVRVNTSGAAVNAADGQFTFNPKELQVVSVSRASSVFNLWTQEPTFSNSAGTISFGGGSPTGYTGSAGTVMTATFKALGAGTPKVQFKSGSVLAADGQGTNVLTAMNGSSFTIAAPADAPAPEYIPPANTPQAPVVTSDTHPDASRWYRNTTAKLSWTVPSGVTAVRTLLDTAPGTVPTIVYDEPITERTISDLPQGVSYFHVQFKNADGWGRIAHYRLGVDTEEPEGFTITEAVEDTTSPTRALLFTVKDTSPIALFRIQIDGKEPIEHPGSGESVTRYTLPSLTPGYHTVSVEAVDSAGNARITTHSLTITAFERPVFTEYPTRINTEVIPAIMGSTQPNAGVFVEVVRVDTGAIIHALPAELGSAEPTLVADAAGSFIFIPDNAFEAGVYELRVVGRDVHGRISEPSEPIRIIAEVPGYITFGTALVTVLSVLIPLVALVLLLAFGSWFLWHRLALWRRRVRKEAREAEDQLAREFKNLIVSLNTHVDSLKASRKGKLTKAEAELLHDMERDLTHAEARIAKEITDIEQTLK